MTSLAFASLVDRGLVSYDQKVTSVWPEFAKQQKEDVDDDVEALGKRKSDITLADVMRHEAGLANFQGLFDSTRAMWMDNIKKNRLGEVIERETCKYGFAPTAVEDVLCVIGNLLSTRYPPPSFGSSREYHSLTRGFILNEVFRRVDPEGRTIGQYVKEVFREHMGLDIYIGKYE